MSARQSRLLYFWKESGSDETVESMSALKHAAMVAVLRYGSVGLNWIIGIILARSLAVEERGQFALVVTVVSVANLIATAGADTSTLRAAGGDGVATSVRYAFRASRNVLYLAVPLTILVWFTAGSSIIGAPTVPLGIAMIALPAMVLYQLLSNTFLGNGSAKTWALGNLLMIGTYGGGTAAVAISGLTEVWIFTVCYASGYIVSAGFFAYRSKLWRLAAIDVEASLEQRRVRVAVFLPTLLQVALLRGQIFLLQELGTTRDVGLLSVVLPFAEILLIAPVAISTVLLPRLGAGRVENTAKIATVAFGVTSVGAAAVALAAPYLVPTLYGAEYADAVMALWIIVPTLPLFSVARIIQTRLYAKKVFTPVTVSTGIAVTISCVIQVLVTPSTGITGAAVAIAAGYVALSLGLLISGRLHRTEKTS